MPSVLCTILLGVIAGWYQIIEAADNVEICPLEGKSLRCLGDQVLLIQSARYGRMNIGRCLNKNVRRVGCGTDVLALVDKWCSGLKDCTLDEGFYPLYNVQTTCPPNLSKYLEVSYTCLTVAQPQQLECDGRDSSVNMLRPDTGFISSYVSYTTDCGYAKSPWIIQTQPQDHIELTILDFSVLDNKYNEDTKCGVLYATIVERNPATETQICRGKKRERIIYSSRTNLVEIRIARQITHRFVIHYRSTHMPRLPKMLAYGSGNSVHMYLHHPVFVLGTVGYFAKYWLV